MYIYRLFALSGHAGCAQNVSTRTTAVSGAPISSHGRVRVRSLSEPMTGSFIASQKRETSISSETAAMLMPQTSV